MCHDAFTPCAPTMTHHLSVDHVLSETCMDGGGAVSAEGPENENEISSTASATVPGIVMSETPEPVSSQCAESTTPPAAGCVFSNS